jgi:hypothetical protein
VNIGTNRWSFKPDVGVSKALGKFTLELTTGVTFYTENDNFFGGKTREQDPLYWNASGNRGSRSLSTKLRIPAAEHPLEFVVQDFGPRL